jgi:hypothetical protein
VSEGEDTRLELEDSLDDEAIITSDYKMKILACFFRENQKRWFGKRGTSMIGHMIVTNSSDLEARAKGVKDVKFVMLLSDDTLQDDDAVICAKHLILNECLPEGTIKYRCCSDGAGNYKSKLQGALQPLWKHWTGVDKVSLRLAPAGDGKSVLDGMFAKSNAALKLSTLFVRPSPSPLSVVASLVNTIAS